MNHKFVYVIEKEFNKQKLNSNNELWAFLKENKKIYDVLIQVFKCFFCRDDKAEGNWNNGGKSIDKEKKKGICCCRCLVGLSWYNDPEVIQGSKNNSAANPKKSPFTLFKWCFPASNKRIWCSC